MANFLSLITPMRALLLALTIALGVQTFRIGALQVSVAEKSRQVDLVREQMAQLQLDAANMARAAEAVERQKELEHAQDVQRLVDKMAEDRSRTAAATAGSEHELGLLRYTLSIALARGSQAGGAAAPASGTDGPAAGVGTILSQCAGEYVQVAGDADRLTDQVRGLQSWARSALATCGPHVE
jgi:hypothetical protein